MPVFETVIGEHRSVSKNFKLELKNETFYFKCLMHPYDDMVLCQYRDITQRSNVKRQLEQANRTLREIQKVAQIGHWTYNTAENVFHYTGYTGVLCKEDAAYLFRYVQAVNNGGGSPCFRELVRKECVGIQPGKYQLPDPAGRGIFSMCVSRLICGRNCPTAVAI